MTNHTTFLDTLFEQIQMTGLDVSDFDLDHIAFQASSSENYDSVKADFHNLGTEEGQAVIGGRRVAVFSLHKPWKYRNYTITTLEIIEPKPDQQFEPGFQHAEFIFEQPFENLLKEYPNINWDTSSMHREEFAHLKLHFENGTTLKFLHAPILDLFNNRSD